MFKLIVLATVLAAAAAKPSTGIHLAYSSPLIASHVPLAAPLAYSAPLAHIPAVATPLAAPITRIAAPVALSAPIAKISAPVAIPAPVTYSTGVEVSVAAEPVEQHGYKIVY